MAKNSHLDIVFARSVRVQRAHIANEPSARLGEDLMRVADKGKNALVEYGIAQDLIIAGSAVLNNKSNAEVIEAIRKEASEETARHQRELAAVQKLEEKKKAA